MAKRYKVPRGTYDILPETSYKWQFITDIFRQVAAKYNYLEIVTPMFEESEIFERSVGEQSDIIEKEMYKFEDKKGRELALRPEGTAPVVRSFIENGLHLTPNGTKLYYLGPMFRYDRPQKGRYRQFYQYGIENIGSDDPYIDAEVIAFAQDYLTTLGLKNFELRINSIGSGKDATRYDDALRDYFKPYFDDLCTDCKKRLKENPKRVLDCKVKTCKQIAKDAPSMLEYLDESSQTHFRKVQDYLDELQIDYKVDPTIVRGLDYYTNTAFEFIDTNLGAQNTLIGGGRYNGLLEQLGGNDMPGIGFAGGFERLLLSMEAEELSAGKKILPEVYLIVLGKEARNKGIKILSELRADNISGEFDPDKTSMNAQMKAANKSKAKFTLILGENELKEDKIVLKNMATGDQKLVAIKDIVSQIKAE